MRRQTWKAWLLAAWALAAPAGGAYAQDYAPPDPVVPLPLYSTRPEAGGFFFDGDFVFFRQTNPIKDQNVAIRGFQTFDSQVLGPNTAGVFVGSGAQALNVQQVSGPGSYQPGFRIGAGYKLSDGSAFSVNFMRLTEAKFSAVATLVPPTLQPGQNFEETFLFSPVVNFPADFAGPANKVHASPQQGGGVALNSAFGIWDGASSMAISFVQRFTDYDFTYRQTVYENEFYRCSGLMGPRATWIWENFKWRTVSIDENGAAGPRDQATYSNVVSNYMYGAFIGTQQECYWGHGFSSILDLKTTLYMDIVKMRARYELGDRSIANKRARRDFYVVPEVDGMLGMMWYPIEGVQVRVGYDVMAFFNTISSPRPVSFDYSGLDPPYERTFRLFDGFQAGVAIVF